MSTTAFDFYKDKTTSNTNDRVRSLVSSAKNKNQLPSQSRNSISFDKNMTDSSDRNNRVSQSPSRQSPVVRRSQSPTQRQAQMAPIQRQTVPSNKMNLDDILWKELF